MQALGLEYQPATPVQDPSPLSIKLHTPPVCTVEWLRLANAGKAPHSEGSMSREGIGDIKNMEERVWSSELSCKLGACSPRRRDRWCEDEPVLDTYGRDEARIVDRCTLVVHMTCVRARVCLALEHGVTCLRFTRSASFPPSLLCLPIPPTGLSLYNLMTSRSKRSFTAPPTPIDAVSRGLSVHYLCRYSFLFVVPFSALFISFSLRPQTSSFPISGSSMKHYANIYRRTQVFPCAERNTSCTPWT